MNAKPYIVAIIIQVIYTGMFVIIKAAFNQWFNTFVFVFYSQAAASLLLLPIAIVRERMEVVKLRSSSGIAKSALLKEYPNKMLVTVSQSLFSTAQTFVVAAIAERDMSRWKLKLDITLVAILYHGFVVTGVLNYLQVWCMEMKGPVFLAIWFPLCFVFTIFTSSFLGEIIHLGSILGGILLIGGLYSVLWAKRKEFMVEPSGEVNKVEDALDDKGHRKPQENRVGREEYDEETPA
ncbi:hypothetical protein PR202_ga25503 [Eleusine coracana subsp. coracana]|uniref:WAT1-related protein n=1 Tax=Eleusine coracana subsp. coracana TaxID=191504 RepID=A0AAV5DCA2_ELECO|nr:hypothetical protein PR202_ga25442 [Eleusine coracana subsp. coracana]GJN07658.1 hypothetical protein PR202_ga25503 [Eleusine coracana subsp. coracana]